MGSSAQNSSGVHWCRAAGQVQRGSGEGSEGSGEGLGGFGIGAESRARSRSKRFRRRFRRRSGRLWCRASQVRFSRVPKKVPEKVPEALVQSQVRFNRVPEKVPEKVLEKGAEPGKFNRASEKVREKVWEASVQSQVRFGFRRRSGEGLGGFGQVRFNRVSEKVPEKVWEASVQSQVRFNRVPEKVRWRSGRLWCRARWGSTGFRRRSGEGLGGFGAEPGEVQQGSGVGSGEGLGGLGAEPGQVQQEVPEKVGGFGAEPGEVQHGSGEGSEEGSGRLFWCRARSGSTGEGSGEGLGGFGAARSGSRGVWCIPTEVERKDRPAIPTVSHRMLPWKHKVHAKAVQQGAYHCCLSITSLWPFASLCKGLDGCFSSLYQVSWGREIYLQRVLRCRHGLFLLRTTIVTLVTYPWLFVGRFLWLHVPCTIIRISYII